MNLALTMAERSGKEVVLLQAIDHGFDKPLLKESNLAIYFGERLAIVGSNGSGKSTLLKMMLGKSFLIRECVRLEVMLNLDTFPSNLNIQILLYD